MAPPPTIDKYCINGRKETTAKVSTVQWRHHETRLFQAVWLRPRSKVTQILTLKSAIQAVHCWDATKTIRQSASTRFGGLLNIILSGRAFNVCFKLLGHTTYLRTSTSFASVLCNCLLVRGRYCACYQRRAKKNNGNACRSMRHVHSSSRACSSQVLALHSQQGIGTTPGSNATRCCHSHVAQSRS